MDNAQLKLGFHSFVISLSLCKPILAVSRIQEKEEDNLKVGSGKQIIAVAQTCWKVKLSGYPKQSLYGCS